MNRYKSEKERTMTTGYMDKKMQAFCEHFPFWQINAGWGWHYHSVLRQVHVPGRRMMSFRIERMLTLDMPGATPEQVDAVLAYLVKQPDVRNPFWRE